MTDGAFRHAEAAIQTRYSLDYTPGDDIQARRITEWLDAGCDTVTRFFGRAFKDRFEVRIHSDRNSLDRQWQAEWTNRNLYQGRSRRLTAPEA